MKTPTAALLFAMIVIIAGCGVDEKDESGDIPADEAFNPADFTLRDTTRYETFAGGGRFALLYHDGTLTDTVDLAFGVPVLDSGNILFLPFRRRSVSRRAKTGMRSVITYSSTAASAPASANWCRTSTPDFRRRS